MVSQNCKQAWSTQVAADRGPHPDSLMWFNASATLKRTHQVVVEGYGCVPLPDSDTQPTHTRDATHNKEHEFTFTRARGRSHSHHSHPAVFKIKWAQPPGPAESDRTISSTLLGNRGRRVRSVRNIGGVCDAFTNGVVGVTGEDGGEAGDADERGGYHRHRRRVDAAKGWVLVPLDISDIS